MQSTTPQPAFSLNFCETDAPRSGLTTLLLATATLWLTGITGIVASSGNPFIIVSAIAGSVLLAIVTIASWSTRIRWRGTGHHLLWVLAGMTISVWMIGITGFGWLFMPLLLCEAFALQFWPSAHSTRIPVSRRFLCLAAGFAFFPLLILTRATW